MSQWSSSPSIRGVNLCGLALAICMGAGGCSKSPDPTPSSSQPTGTVDDQPAIFEEVTSAAGLDFVLQPGPYESYFLPQIMTGGAALFDFDSDGDLDLFLVNGNPATASDQSEGVEAHNRLYRQEPDGRFRDVTRGSGLEDPGVFGMGVAAGDINNDGLIDLYLTNYGADRLMLNTGEGVFVDVTEEAGIDNRRWSSSAGFFDYDQDGWLDLFVSNFLDYVPGRVCETEGVREFCGPNSFGRTADVLYRNLGAELQGGRSAAFADVSDSAGIAGKLGAGLTVGFADFNRDGRPDVYVGNDSHANFMWLNQGNGTFHEEAVLMGAAYDKLGQGQASMGVAIADLNADQRPDITITHLASETNAYYLSKGLHFEEESARSGIAAASFPFTSWGVAFLDLDHDGDLDCPFVNGRISRRAPKAAKAQRDDKNLDPWAPYCELNQILINDGSGGFQPLASRQDAFLKDREMSRSLAYGDIDNDGDCDVLVTNIAGRARLFVNQSAKRGAWLMIRAVDPRFGPRDAYGAELQVHANNRVWTQWVSPASGYLTSNDPRVHFGLGEVDEIESVIVAWPDGLKEKFSGISINALHVLTRGEGEPL